MASKVKKKTLATKKGRGERNTLGTFILTARIKARLPLMMFHER